VALARLLVGVVVALDALEVPVELALGHGMQVEGRCVRVGQRRPGRHDVPADRVVRAVTLAGDGGVVGVLDRERHRIDITVSSVALVEVDRSAPCADAGIARTPATAAQVSAVTLLERI